MYEKIIRAQNSSNVIPCKRWSTVDQQYITHFEYSTVTRTTNPPYVIWVFNEMLTPEYSVLIAPCTLYRGIKVHWRSAPQSSSERKKSSSLTLAFTVFTFWKGLPNHFTFAYRAQHSFLSWTGQEAHEILFLLFVSSFFNLSWDFDKRTSHNNEKTTQLTFPFFLFLVKPIKKTAFWTKPECKPSNLKGEVRYLLNQYDCTWFKIPTQNSHNLRRKVEIRTGGFYVVSSSISECYS